MVFQKPTPFPMTIYDNIAFGIKLYERMPRIRTRRPRRRRAAARRAVGRSEGQAAGIGPEPFGRPAAAPVHRAHRGDEAGSDSAGRALLGARSDLDRQDRRADRRTGERIHHRHRHPQHAAGLARVRLHGLHVSGRAGRIRRRPRRSSPRPRTSAPKNISPAGSAKAYAPADSPYCTKEITLPSGSRT